MKTILITGVSTGIGAAAAREFLGGGHRVIGTVRKSADAQELVQLGKGQFHPIILDMVQVDAVMSLGQKVSEILGNDGLDGFINNAGIATAGSIIDQPYEDYLTQFQVNVFSPLLVLRQLFPFLTKAKGRVIQIGSVAGEMTSPFLAAYSASKHAMEAQSDGMRRELLLVGISVVHIQFGPVITPIWGKFAPEIQAIMEKSLWSAAFEKFAKYINGRSNVGITAEIAGKKIVQIFQAKHPKTRYAILKNKLIEWTIPRRLPDKLVDAAIAKALGLFPKN